MTTHVPTHQGLERVVLIGSMLGRLFRSLRRSLAISQPPADVKSRPRR